MAKTERGQYLNIINVMAARATSTSLEALSLQVQQPQPPQQAVTAPPQQRA